MSAHVSWIHVAPIKALAIQELQEVELGRLGVENARRFSIVDPDGKMLNAKRVQRFVAIRPHLDDEMRTLVLDMPDGAEAPGTGAIRPHLDDEMRTLVLDRPDGSKATGPVRLGDAITVSIYRRQTPARVVEGPW